MKRAAATWLAIWLLISSAVAAGVLVGSLLAGNALATSRAAQLAVPPSPSGMTTERPHPLPSPERAGQPEGPESVKRTPRPLGTVGPDPDRITPVPIVGQPSAPARVAALTAPSENLGKRPAPTDQPPAAKPPVALTPAAGVPPVAGTIFGLATYYDYVPGGAAAGPVLRAALGPGWRGSTVIVTRADLGAAVKVTLSDWCACADRNGVPTLIDLDTRSFAALAPLSVGVIRVRVTPVPAPPETSTP